MTNLPPNTEIQNNNYKTGDIVALRIDNHVKVYATITVSHDGKAFANEISGNRHERRAAVTKYRRQP